jgi:hypothetical protein
MVRRRAVALRPLTRFSSTGSLSGNDRSCAPASCQTRWWRGLSRDCQPSRGSSLAPTRLFESPCGAGLLIPLEDAAPLPERRLLSTRHLAPCRSSTGLAFRALFLPEIRRSFELTRALLSVALPRSPHASSVKSGLGLLSKLIRPREGPSKPSSGLCSLRESVPLRVRFRVA